MSNEAYRPNWLKTALLSTAGIALAMSAVPVAAQDDAETDTAELEEITVTGSRIARTDLTSMSPVSVISSEEFRLSGTVNVEELLNTLPQVVPGLTGASNNPGAGFSTVNLRNLGSNRNLVLVNGRRFVPTTQGGTVDINNIPAALIEKVEVVTGGASAVYGSDAISGVINFILKDDFEGMQATYAYQITELGDGDIHDFSLLMGGNFADGRGNAIVFANYNERKPVFADARPFSTFALDDALVIAGTRDPKFGFSAPCEDPATQTCVEGLAKGGSSGIPGTRVFGGPLFDADGDGVIGSAGDIPIGRFGTSGDPLPFQDPQDRFNFSPANFIQIPLERWTITANARYEILPDVLNMFFEGNFVNTRSPQELAPTPAFLSTLVVDVDSPFFSAASQAALANIDLASDGVLDGFATLPFIGRRMLEVGPRQAINEFTTYRFVVGFDGELPNGWDWQTYYSFGRVAATNLLNNDVAETKFRQALITEDVGGVLQCTDTSGGCVPLNIFGEGNITEAMADFVRVGAANTTTVQQQIASASVTGQLFDMGAGPVGFAVGFEYRDEASEFRPDAFLTAGDVLGFNAGLATAGSFDLWEMYMETVIPVLQGVPGAERLELSGALRFSDYSLSRVGTVWTYAGGGDWTVIPGFTLRGQFQRAIRAPSISELFQGVSQGFPAASDPCASDKEPFDPVAGGVNAQCLGQGVPDSDGDGIIDSFVQANSQIQGSFGGNPDLQEESANTWTLGAVMQPEFIPGLNITIDYYSIDIDGFISTRAGGVNNIIAECFRIGDPNTTFCQSITRRPDGNINIVSAVNDNLLNLGTQGVDIQMDYNVELADIGLGAVGGTLSILFIGTFTINNDFQTIPTADVIECAGFFGPTCGEPTPEWGHSMRTTWSSGPLQVSLRWRYLGAVDDFDEQNIPRIGAQHYFALSSTYQVTDYLNVFAGVNNLGDNKPPMLGDSNEQTNTFPSTYDVLGRRFFMGATARF